LSSLNVSRTVVSVLYDELKIKEESIEKISPIKDWFWEKNLDLKEQVAAAIKKISDSANYTPFDMLKNLPVALSFIEPCVWTIAQYNSKNERLLNYPVAKAAIENQLKKKRSVSVKDLPFQPQDAEEYLKLFFNERSGEFRFDEENLLLSKKTI